MVDTIFKLVSPACYFDEIEPSVAAFRASGNTDAIVRLLRRGQERMLEFPDDQCPFLVAGERFDFIQDALDVIEGREFYRPSANHVPTVPGDQTTPADLQLFIESQVYDLLFHSLCTALETNVPTKLILTRGGLLPYLYRHSRSLEDAFTTGALQGEPLSLLSQGELLSKESVAHLLNQLESVPLPNDEEEQKKEQAKWEALQGTARVFVSSQFAGVLGPSASQALHDLKTQLKRSLADPSLTILQEFG